MSLFVRLWIMGTLIALSAAGIAVLARELVTVDHLEASAGGTAKMIVRLMGHSIAMDPLSDRQGEAAAELLRDRARQLVASGRLLSVTVVDQQLRPLASETAPGLEDEDAYAVLGAGPFAAVRRDMAPQVTTTEDLLFVLAPLIDNAGVARGVMALGVPMDVLHVDYDEEVVFASLATVLAVLLGLIAASVLTGQVARPIVRLAAVADRLETGRFDTASVTSLIGRRDEIGRLARVILRLVQALDHLGTRMDEAVEERLRERGGR